MNNRIQKLAVLLLATVGYMQAEHNLFIKIPKGIKYDFDVQATLKNDTDVQVSLKKEGDSDVFIANLKDIVVSKFFFATSAYFKSYKYKDIQKVITKAVSEMAANPKKDYLITIESVGGFATGVWKSKNEWIAETPDLTIPIKLINASDWNLEISYKEKPQEATRSITEYLVKKDQSKADSLELADVQFIDAMTLKGKYATPGTWTGWLGAATDSTRENISAKINTEWGKLNLATETLAVIVKHVGRVTGGGLVGRAWDVEVKVVKQSDKAEDIAKAYSVGATTGGAPTAPGKGAGKPKAPKPTVLTTAGENEIVVQNNSELDITVDFKRNALDTSRPNPVAKLNNYTIAPADRIAMLTFAAPGKSTYNAMPILKDAQKALDPARAQHVIFNVRRAGNTESGWIVKAKVVTYGLPKVATKVLTYKHGGKIKQK